MSGERVVMLDNFHVTYLFTGTCTVLLQFLRKNVSLVVKALVPDI